jgi:hypothetical protein
MGRTDCTDVCEVCIDYVCTKCNERETCLDVEGNESEFHEQLIQCIYKVFKQSELSNLL